MPRRQAEIPVWRGQDEMGDATGSMPVHSKKLSLWLGEILLVVIVIVGFVVLTSAIFKEPGPRPAHVALTGHTQDVEAVAFSPDGRTLASCGWDNSVRLWDLNGIASGAQANDPVVLPHDSVRFAVAFSPDGSRLACGGHNSLTIWACAAKRYEPLVRKVGHTYRCLAFSPDGKALAIGCDDGTVRLLSPDSADESAVLRGHHDSVRSVAFSPDGTKLVSSGQDREILLWNATTGERIRSLGRPGTNPVQLVAFSPLGNDVAVGEVSGSPQAIILVDPQTGDIRSRLAGHGSGVSALAFSPDGSTLATAGGDRTIKIWNTLDGQERGTLSEEVGCVRSISFSPDGDWLAFAGNDLTIRVWHVSHGLQTRLVGRCPLKA